MDKNGNPILNEKGEAVYVDDDGNEVNVKVDKNGNPIVDESG